MSEPKNAGTIVKAGEGILFVGRWAYYAACNSVMALSLDGASAVSENGVDV